MAKKVSKVSIVATVEKNGVVHDCTSEEMLKRFLAAGYKKVKAKGTNANGEQSGGEETGGEETEN